MITGIKVCFTLNIFNEACTAHLGDFVLTPFLLKTEALVAPKIPPGQIN